MLNKIFNPKYLYLSIVTVFFILLIGIISPLIVSNYSDNWQVEFNKKESLISKRIQSIVSEKETELLKNILEIQKNVSELKPVETIDFLEFLKLGEYKNFEINIFKSAQFVGWNKEQLITYYEIKNLLTQHRNRNAFFFETSLITYLAIISEIDSVQIFIAIPIQKKHKLKNAYYENLSLTDFINKEYNISVSIKFNNDRIGGNSYYIKNNLDEIIGSFKINEISKNADIQKLKEEIALLQSIFAIFLIVFLFVWVNYRIKIKNALFKIIYFTFSIITIRIIIYILSIGDYLGFSDLINPIYFSSTFAFGLTKSPLELFLTITAVLLLSIKIFFSFPNKNNFENLRKANKVLLIIIILSLIILLYNGFASALKSIIFDSSILYFKDASLYASYQTIFMYLNIFLIGLTTALFSITFISLLIELSNGIMRIRNYIFVPLLFLVLLAFILIDEFFFAKSSILFSLFFLLFVFGISSYWKYYKVSNLTKMVTLLFSGSILSISFLNFFNTQLEINSLKTISNELTRSNVGLYEYYVDDALNKAINDTTLATKIAAPNNNLNAEAFLLWTKTYLSTEVQASVINIIDINKNLIGSFEYKLNKPFWWNWDELESGNKVARKIDVFNEKTSSKIISVITKIEDRKSLVGYVEIVAVYDAFNIETENNDKLISSINPFKKLSVNLDLLKIYEFRNNQITNYFTNIFLTKREEEAVKNTPLVKNEEVWKNIDIDGENNIFYIKKYADKNGEKLIAVGLSDKDITWNLFDFFKVFFIHSIMIFVLLIITILIKYNEWKNFRISFKSKILISLLIVSIIPLILLAWYFKNITDGKNEQTINYKLGKRADSVEEYINTYINSSSLKMQSIFDKATKDLGINYSIYENENLIYSSQGTYYRIGLLPLILNPDVLVAINKYGMKEVIVEENIEKFFYNTLYHKSDISGEEFIIKVTDLFNNYQLPMSGLELNVFLFGTYSLAIIFIIILSTILANQISSPIEKLTKATRSVSHGDMDIQLHNNQSGEVKELIEGFNLMVRELKKNQIELAEVERESAWREMAKQVAHEIKNPLTPMKLAVQHLVAAHNDKSEKYNSIFEKVTSTIINQIDTLKNIASEFSNFAKMPSLKLEKLDVLVLVNEIVDLFIDEDCSINISSSETSIIVTSDKEQFQRMMINLIRNSIQANAKEIIIFAVQNYGKVELLIKDNGSGIASSILSRIFEENFTTKKNGMGLGLALIKRFLNQTNGEIFVEQTSEKGTTIKIEIRTDV
ncbi:MAG: HAMP domain-containing protein [Bacteroidetes bacterium]|nr:HAMP domain-containing protein [Bacteroidota bacterium]MBU1797541.1 HAMP domain-containing protein [Bacteroidota bacterium]